MLNLMRKSARESEHRLLNFASFATDISAAATTTTTANTAAAAASDVTRLVQATRQRAGSDRFSKDQKILFS